MARSTCASTNCFSRSGRSSTMQPRVVEAHARLAQHPGIRFVGNVEGHELVRGKADVIVCEGLLGNVVLKLIEGIADWVVEDTEEARLEAERASGDSASALSLPATSPGLRRAMTS